MKNFSLYFRQNVISASSFSRAQAISVKYKYEFIVNPIDLDSFVLFAQIEVTK